MSDLDAALYARRVDELERDLTRLRTALERIAFQSADDIAVSIARLALHPPRCCTGLAPECVAAGKCLHPPREAPEALAALLEMAAEGYVHRSMLAAPPEKGTGADDEYTAGILARQPMKPIPPLDPPCETCHGEGKVLHMYARGTDDPPGNLMIPCPICRPTPEAPR